MTVLKRAVFACFLLALSFAAHAQLTIEITGGEGKIEKFIDLMKGFGILDLTRTGQVALPRS